MRETLSQSIAKYLLDLPSYPSSKLSSKNQDSGVYVCKRNVLDFLKQKSEFESFRDEMIPWLCKMQYQRGKRAKYSKGTLIPVVKLRACTLTIVE